MRPFGTCCVILLAWGAAGDDCVFTEYLPPNFTSWPAWAYGLNVHGDFVGVQRVGTYPNDVDYAFVYVDGFWVQFGQWYNMPRSEAVATNDNRQVIGNYWPSGSGGTGPRRAFFYDIGNAGDVVDLGSFGGGSSRVGGINNSGLVVGAASRWDLHTRAFLWDGSAKIDIHPPFPSNDESAAGDVNDQNVVVGTYGVDATGGYAVFTYNHTDGVFTDLGSPLGLSLVTVTAVNNHGDIVGYGYDDTPGQAGRRAFLYDADTASFELLPIAADAYAWDIDDRGQIVGTGGPTGAFIYRNGAVQYMRPDRRENPALTCINRRGDIAGYARGYAQGSYVPIPFTLDFHGDLNCDGSVNAFDINPFVLALGDPDGYAGTYPGCEILNGDVNDDGSMNAFDIEGFVARLTNCP